MSLDSTRDWFEQYLAEGARRLAELDERIRFEDFLEGCRAVAHPRDLELFSKARRGEPLRKCQLRRIEYLERKGVVGDVVTAAQERTARRSSDPGIAPRGRVSGAR